LGKVPRQHWKRDQACDPRDYNTAEHLIELGSLGKIVEFLREPFERRDVHRAHSKAVDLWRAEF
jgi:hypothetical protein